MKVKLNVNLGGYKKGSTININMKDLFWRRRLADSKTDNCLEIINNSQDMAKIINDEEIRNDKKTKNKKGGNK